MKKKFFNLAVILATLMSSAVFSSCGDDDDEEEPKKEVTPTDKEDQDKKEEESKQDAEKQSLPSVQVVAGGEYSASNPAKSFTFKVISVEGTLAAKNQVVVLSIDGFDGSLQLSDAGDSYLLFDGTNFSTANTAKAKDNVKNIVACLASANSTADFTITSATVNDTMKSLGATETLFSKNK